MERGLHLEAITNVASLQRVPYSFATSNQTANQLESTQSHTSVTDRARFQTTES